MHSESESDSETMDSYDKENRLQRSLDSFVEPMDVDIEPSGDLSSHQRKDNGNGQRQSLNGTTDESDIDLESPFRRPAFTARYTSNIDGNSDDENFVDSGVDRSTSSTPSTSSTSAGTTRLKPPVNIFKIDLEKVDEAIDKARKGATRNNTDRIAFMIAAANPKCKSKRARQSRGQELESYAQRPYDGFVNTKFELVYYEKITYCTDEETQREGQKTHKIRFLHRADTDAEEIFALPSGSGRNAVLQWADTSFPLSIASATLDPKSVTEKEVKNLYENRYLTRCKMKMGESLQTTPEFHLRFAPQIYTRYHANINGTSEKLKRILGHDNESIVKMTLRNIVAQDFAISGDPNLPRYRDFDGYLSKVTKDRNVELDKLLLKELEQFYRLTSRPHDDDVYGKLKNFMITKKDSTKYFEAAEFSIYFQNKLVKSTVDRPQLHELHTIVNKNCTANSLSSFVQKFHSLTICTPPQTAGERIIKEKLFNCLEGVLYDEITKKNYWRVSSNWYEVSGKYSCNIYAEFIRVLKRSLLEKPDCSLKYLWQLHEVREELLNDDRTNKKTSEFSLKEYLQKRFVKEADYSKQYATQKYFTVTDGGLAPHGLEICDLVQFVRNPDGKFTINLYHVKKAFGADGHRVAICQILSGVYYLHASFTNPGSTDSAAHKLFSFIEKQGKFPTATSYDEFLEQLRKATIVYAPLFDSGNRELDKEYVSRSRYDFSDFEEFIEPELREDLRNRLETFLLESGYIYRDKDFTQKWYDACAVPRDKGFDVVNDRGRHVDPFPRTPKLDPKQLRRILKKIYYKTVDGLGIKQLIVHLSEVVNFMGFGFKICQIEGAGDELLTKKLQSRVQLSK